LAFGAAPHEVPKDDMFFDPVRGGWVRADDKYGMPPQNPKPPSPPPMWKHPDPAAPVVKNANKIPRARDKLLDSKHFEKPHYGNHRLDMQYEANLGLVPPDWSVTSAMDDPRPNGKAIFDARFVESPVGRARAGRSMVWDSRGTAHSGSTKKAENWDAGAMADAAEEDFDGLEKEWTAQEGAGVVVRQASGF